MCKQSNRGVTYDRIYSTVRRIPKGRVATYGQIACLVGIPRQRRQVGYALAALRDYHPVPWHRVVNSKGEISQRSESGFEELQRILSEGEGVVFDESERGVRSHSPTGKLQQCLRQCFHLHQAQASNPRSLTSGASTPQRRSSRRRTSATSPSCRPSCFPSANTS